MCCKSAMQVFLTSTIYKATRLSFYILMSPKLEILLELVLRLNGTVCILFCNLVHSSKTVMNDTL
jgi:hypothetical protein